MVRYASVADVQARLQGGVQLIDENSEPSRATVEDWLDAQSLWLDAALAWKYAVPITHAEDRRILRTICAALVASQVWALLGAHSGDQPSGASELRKEALQLLAYDARSGQARLVLRHSGESDSGAAAGGQPVSSFSDPDSDDGIPRMFEIGKDAW